MAFATLVICLVVFSTALSAENEKKLNLFGGVGIAASDFEGMVVLVGIEKQLSDKFYAQLMFDYYLNPSGEDIEGMDDSAYGVNLYGVYKHPLSENFHVFIKGGINYTTYKVSVEAGGITISGTDGYFGIGGGAGFEYGLNDKIALILGATAKTLFTSEDDAFEKPLWFKIYGAVSFRLK